jgi:hypothetical protein
MRRTPDRHEAIYHTFSVEDLMEPEHPLRPIKRMVDTARTGLSRTFRAAYSDTGRSEPELCRRLRTDLLFRWFLDLQRTGEVFDHSVFSHNRDRMSAHGPSESSPGPAWTPVG